MNKNDKKKIYRINDVVALCHVINEFEKFEKNIIDFLTVRDPWKLSYKLKLISKGQSCFNSKKVKQFYEDNKSVIDTINMYSDIDWFIIHNYNTGWMPIEHSDIYNYLYKYVLDNKENVNGILEVLEKVNTLGFTSFGFSQDTDFSNSEYYVNKYIREHQVITYMDNLEVVPTYESDLVKYKTNGSDFVIKLYYRCPGGLTEKLIFLNNLTFDASRLPDTLSAKEFFNEIMELQNQREQEHTIVKNSVDLSVRAEDLFTAIDNFDRVINGLDSVDTKEKLVKLLADIKDNASRIQVLSNEYDSNMIANNEHITEDLLTKEKKLFKKRRFLSTIDDC